ncbi:hypothetical protein PMHK_11810 [Pseudomonas sp. MHK4]
MLSQKRQQQARQRALVGRVHVEMVGTHHHAFDAGAFKDQNPGRTQHPQRFSDQLLQDREFNMFGDLEAGYGNETVIRQLLQSAERVILAHWQLQHATCFKHTVIEIYP